MLPKKTVPNLTADERRYLRNLKRNTEVVIREADNESAVKDILSRLQGSGFITEDMATYTVSVDPKPTRLYILPKVHTSGCPGKTYCVCCWITYIKFVRVGRSLYSTICTQYPAMHP